MSTITKHQCDICEKPAVNLQIRIQVVFTTEQTEGRPCSPHLVDEVMDLCGGCLARIIERHPIRASGAQGHNTYVLS